MNFKFLAILTFFVAHAIATNVTSAGRRDDQKCNEDLLKKIFVYSPVGTIIAEYLSHKDLQNIAEIPVMSGSANFVLKRRSKILHYRDGKINPPYLRKAYDLISRTNFTDSKICPFLLLYNSTFFEKCHWSPYEAILFGSEKPLNVVTGPVYCGVLIVMSCKDHLKIFSRTMFGSNDAFISGNETEEEENPMNGLIVPYFCHLDIQIRAMPIKSILNNWRNYQSWIEDKERLPLKLAIVISNDNDQEDAEKQALSAIEIIKKDFDSVPICFVAQPDTRKNVKNSEKNLKWQKDCTVLMLHGSDIQTHIFVMDKKYTNETLRAEFEKLKKELFFLDNHETVAFHFTVVNGTEPEDSEEIFSNTFPDIPVSTLRLLDESSTTGVYYDAETEFRFYGGPVYVIIGTKKYA